MDKEQIKKLAGDPNYIPGIYNYCDRWCERCSQTSRCMVFTLSEDEFTDPETHDIRNKKFWQNLEETFQVTRELLKELAEKEGIDLDALDLEEGADEERVKDETANNHECSRSAKDYGKIVNSWFETAKDLFEEKEGELIMKVKLEIPDIDPLGEASSLSNAVEVIRWYQYQIYVKMMRALRGGLDESTKGEDKFPRDSDGSAKVALIGLDRSIAAWGEILKNFPEREDELLDILLHLDRLRRKVEAEFPAARAFVRPGFDDEKVKNSR
jgi:hypothetical protein